MAKDLKKLKHLGIILILDECETQIYCFRCAKTYKSGNFANHSGCKSYWFEDDDKINYTINKKINVYSANGELEMKIDIKSQKLTNSTSIARHSQNAEMKMQALIGDSNNLKKKNLFLNQIDREISAEKVPGSNKNEQVASEKNDNSIKEIKDNSENDCNAEENDSIEVEYKNENCLEEKWEQSSEESDYELPAKQMKCGEKTIEEIPVKKQKYFRHTCYLCSDKNMGYFDYKKHLRQKHDVLNCNCGCGIKYPSFLEYRKHRSYYCIYCGYNGHRISKRALGTHCCPNKEYFCHICSKQFTMKQGLESHIDTTHKKITRYYRHYRCTFCTYKANRKNNLRVHYYMHNVIIKDGEKTPHLLLNKIGENENLCNRKYNNECYVCFKKFNQKNYTTHFFRMHGKEQCPYKCAECSQLFHYYAEYKLHLPNKCFYCGANTCKDEEHQCDLKIPKLRCDFCHIIFKHKDRFLKHNEICKETNFSA